MEQVDAVVIGAGSGGLSAAEFGAQLGLKMVLIEKNKIGGDCTWYGCVPSKALLKIAQIAQDVRTASDFGIATAPPTVDMVQVKHYINNVIRDIYAHETPEELEKRGIEVVMGEATFVERDVVQVGERKLKPRYVFLATGGRPFIPPIEGLADVPYHTNETLWDNERLPQHFMVIGGGPIGSEIAQGYRRLGAEVTVIDVDLLPREEPEARETVRAVFGREGIKVVQGLVASARMDGNDIVLRLKDSGEEIRGDMLLIAAGRRPTVDNLGLDIAGVDYTPKGIQVNNRLRTSNRRVYALGDALGKQQFTHYAAWQGSQAVRNAFLKPFTANALLDTVPATTFTDPEIARAGLTEAEARQRYGADVKVHMMGMDRTDRAVAEDDTEGFIKVVSRQNNKILGATVVNARAGDQIIEFINALDGGKRVGSLAEKMHVYPTYSTGIQLLSAFALAEEVVGGPLEAIVKLIARLN
ncbi:MAG: FAD-dependent oxidoreductase [Chloroflexi bacterium]|nr:FAD-dependent oxidoreductase [Chloroflexota bacterium]